MSEVLVCIDLGLEYEMNFASHKKMIDQGESSKDINNQIN
jgi:hypothetical protein